MGSLSGVRRRRGHPSGLSPAPSPLVDVGPAEQNTSRVIDEYSATVRGSAAVFAALIGVASTPVSPWQQPICILVMAWAVVRLVCRKRRSGPGWVGVDLLVAGAVGLTAPLTTPVTDLAAMRGFAINVVNPISLTFAWLPRRGVAVVLCIAVLGCFLASVSVWTGTPFLAMPATYVLPIQSALSWALVGIFMPAARSADTEAARRVATAIELDVAAARRAAEQEHWAVMHDTAASTLLMVGDGIPATANERIRRQASRDLDTIARPSDGPTDRMADLAQAVRQQVRNAPIAVDLHVGDLALVPADVMQAVVGALRELLTNVERHAGTATAVVRVIGTQTGFELLVHDDGVGFDPVNPGRGLRHSVLDRMQRVGGRVRVRSATDGGTTIMIEWSTS